MSFAYDVREELCRNLPEKLCCRRALCYGILLYANIFSRQEIRIVTESDAFAAFLPRLFNRTFSITLEDTQAPGGEKHIFSLRDPAQIQTIFSAYGQEHAVLSQNINYAVLENDCCRRNFFRGAFLAGGSVTDPEKRYHLELATTHKRVSDGAVSLLHELGIEARQVVRSGVQVLYLKKSETIADFLTMMGAPLSAMKLMQVKMEKQLRSGVNRRCNCDSANLSKAVNAAQEQLHAIHRLRDSGALRKLSPALQEAAALREAQPEATLSELAAACDPPISKPAFSGRIRRLLELSRERGRAAEAS